VSGIAVSSASGLEVVKLFSDEDLARHEVNVLRRARGLAVPDLHGVVSDRKKTGVVMSYGGSSFHPRCWAGNHRTKVSASAFSTVI
jgi:hypothetical protein